MIRIWFSKMADSNIFYSTKDVQDFMPAACLCAKYQLRIIRGSGILDAITTLFGIPFSWLGVSIVKKRCSDSAFAIPCHE